MATLWVLLFSTIMYVGCPADATPLYSRVVRSYEDCFKTLEECPMILTPGLSVRGLANLSSKRWFHCQCINTLKKCIESEVGPYTEGRNNAADQKYLVVTGGVCFRDKQSEYEKVPAPANVDHIAIFRHLY